MILDKKTGDRFNKFLNIGLQIEKFSADNDAFVFSGYGIGIITSFVEFKTDAEFEEFVQYLSKQIADAKIKIKKENLIETVYQTYIGAPIKSFKKKEAI